MPERYSGNFSVYSYDLLNGTAGDLINSVMVSNGKGNISLGKLSAGVNFFLVNFTYADNSSTLMFSINVAENNSSSVNINTAKIALSKTSFTYNNGKVQKPTVSVSDNLLLKEGVDYKLVFSSASSKKAGTYIITITGIGNYTGTVKVTYKINKATNPLKIKAKTVKVKFSKKKTKTFAVSKVIKFTKKGQGTLTYAKSSGNKKITINKKNRKSHC